MGSGTERGCLAFTRGPAVDVFLIKSTATRLPSTAAMDIDITHGGATDHVVLGLIEGEAHGRIRAYKHRVAEERVVSGQ
jgi:hypothetical protein